MKVNVTKDRVSIVESDDIHAGEYNVNNLQFSFSDEYSDNLVKNAIFTNDNGNSYQVSIINNKCQLPAEILTEKGSILFGVYAYQINGEKLELRYSPFPTSFVIISGSYDSTAEEGQEITPSQFEQYMQALNDGLNKVEESLAEMDEATSSTNDLVDDINQKLENGDFIGPQGPQGVPGTNGKDGVGITTITSGQPTIEEDKTVTPVTVNKTDGSSQIFNVEAKNGIDGQNGKDGTNGQDGLTPTIGDNGNWYLGDTDTGKPSRGEVGPSPDLTDYVKNTDYATTVQAGVVRLSNGMTIDPKNGNVFCVTNTNDNYKNAGKGTFISKGTLENIKNDYIDSSTPVQELNNNLDNIIPKNTASGEIVSVDDALAYKMFEFKVDGSSEQETTTGKNLLPYPYINDTKTENGITFTDNGDGTITVNGEASTNTYFNLINKDFGSNGFGSYNFPSDTYIASTGLDDAYIRLNYDGNNKYVFLLAIPGKTYNNTIIYPMIRLNSVNDDSYEPYTGGQASPSPDYPQEITTLTFDKITRCGKNLLPNNLTSQTINGISAIVNDDKSITVNGTTEKRTVFYLYSRNTNEIDYILPKGIDFILKSPGLENVGINFQLGLYEPNKTEEYITANGINDRQFKLDNYKIINYFALIVEEGQTVDLTCYPQLEIGIESTEYEFYQGQTYDIDLQGNEMVELPNGVKDELVIDKQGNISLIKNTGKAVLTGSENWKDNWQTSATPDYIQFYLSADFLNNNYINATSKNTLVNRFKADGSVWIFSKEMLALNKDVTYTLQIKMLRSRVSDLASFKEWLSTHNVIVYYQLATPQTIPLGTLSELITTLNGTNNISINGNIPTTISTPYALDIKKYIDNKLAEISTAMIEEG